MSSPEETLRFLILYLRITLEGVGALWIAVGFAYAFIELISAHLHRRTASFTGIRLTFSRYLSLALEFQLASDILSTSIAPSLGRNREIGRYRGDQNVVEFFPFA